MADTVTIKNGKAIKAWVAMIVLVLGFFATAVTGWVTVCSDVKDNSENNRAIVADLAKLHAEYRLSVSELKVLGSDVSRRNQVVIEGMNHELVWIKDGIKDIQKKIDRAVSRNP